MRTEQPTATLTENGSLFLDGLRLASAQAVLLGHAFDFFGWFSSLHDPSHLQIQRLGVALFFLISGFVIPYSVDQKRAPLMAGAPSTYGVRRYFVDRFSRIYCALIPALVLIALIDALPFGAFEADFPAAQTNTSVQVALANALHLQEYPLLTALGHAIPTFGSGDPLWSLSVEWWIYVLFGLVVFKARGTVALLLGAIAVGSVAYNLVGGTGDGIAIVWLLGFATYQVWRLYRPRIGFRLLRFKTPAAIVFGLLAIAAALAWPERSHFGLDLPFAVLSAVAILLYLLGCKSRGPASLGQGSKTQPTVVNARAALPSTARTDGSARTGESAWRRGIRLGAGFSFTLYLTHFSILTVLYDYREAGSGAAMVCTALLACNVIALLVSHLGERHTDRVRSWLAARFDS